MLSSTTKTVLSRLQSFGSHAATAATTVSGHTSNSNSQVQSPFSAWSATPYQRRAAVLVILFETRNPRTQTVELSTVLTTRSAHLSSFSGQVAFPGGKVDFEEETARQAAHREANEEINFPIKTPIVEFNGNEYKFDENNGEPLKSDSLSSSSSSSSFNFSIKDIGNFPAYLARNLLAVTPSIAFVPSPSHCKSVLDLPESYLGLPHVLGTNQELATVLSESGEVAEVFSVPLQHFLYINHPANSSNITRSVQKSIPLPSKTGSIPEDLVSFQLHIKQQQQQLLLQQQQQQKNIQSPPWYHGELTSWNGMQWWQHNFSVLRRTSKKIGEPAFSNVWGMTARILVDVARIGYDQIPEMPYTTAGVGDEPLIHAMINDGYLLKPRSKSDIYFSFTKAFGKDSVLLKGRL